MRRGDGRAAAPQHSLFSRDYDRLPCSADATRHLLIAHGRRCQWTEVLRAANDPDPEPLGPWVGSGGLAAGHRINKLLLVSAHGADLSQEAFSPALCWLVLAATCLCPHTPLMADRNAGARVRGS